LYHINCFHNIGKDFPHYIGDTCLVKFDIQQGWKHDVKHK